MLNQYDGASDSSRMILPMRSKTQGLWPGMIVIAEHKVTAGFVRV
jgi:hypothetical protein